MTTSLRARRAHLAGQQQMFAIGAGGTLEILDNDWARLLHPGCPTRICRDCGRILCQCCFRSHETAHRPMGRFHPDCVICEYEKDEKYRREHVFEQAARTRLADHMRREREQGLHHCHTLADYEVLIGITVAWLAEHMRRAWENDDQCSHCESAGRTSHWQAICPVIEGVPDLSRMTIDRTDPSRRIDKANFELMCLTGNIAKHNTDPAKVAVRNAYWRLHNAERGAAA